MTDTAALDKAAQEAAAHLQAENFTLNEAGLRALFTEARTHNGWQKKPVSEATIKKLYDLVKYAPTGFNMQPARFIFVQSEAAKARLKPALMPGNADKTMAAPVTAIIAYDVEFWKHLPRTFPVMDAQAFYKDAPAFAENHAKLNGSLQVGYFILAARALGLDVGPMSGFNNAAVDEEFFKGTSVKSNVLVNLGYADPHKVYRRFPRLDFAEVAKII